MSSQSSKEASKPEVIIVGAGLGGLLLAQLLEQINVPYHIYERSAEVKPLGMGSTIHLHPGTRTTGKQNFKNAIPLHIALCLPSSRSIGSAMALGPNIFPVFEQLGLLEELKKISFPYRSSDLYTEDMKKLGTMDMSGHEKL